MINNKIVMLIAIVFSISTLYGCNGQRSDPLSENTEEASFEESINDETLDKFNVGNDMNSREQSSAVQETAEEYNTERSIIRPIKVNISNEYNSSLESYDSLSEVDLNRPNNLPPSSVFLGWENEKVVNQIIDRTTDVSSVITLSTISEEITNTENTIYNNAVYVNNDIPTQFFIPIKVGGETSFNTLDLEIEYDSSLIEFVDFTNVDPDAVCNYIEDKNKIYITFSSIDAINAELDLCDLSFKTITNTQTETSLNYIVKEISAWDNETADFYNVKYKIINGKIVMY